MYQDKEDGDAGLNFMDFRVEHRLIIWWILKYSVVVAPKRPNGATVIIKANPEVQKLILDELLGGTDTKVTVKAVKGTKYLIMNSEEMSKYKFKGVRTWNDLTVSRGEYIEHRAGCNSNHEL